MDGASAVSLGEVDTARSGRLGGDAGPAQARVHDADRVVQGPRHDGDGELPPGRGIDRVLEDSSRNAAPRCRPYAAAAGMWCRILVPKTASYPKIAQIAACGTDVVAEFRARAKDVAEAALRQAAGIFYASHNWQPLFVEGVKTLAYELRYEQLGFRAPDNVVVPLGYGSNVLGCERFAELLRGGEVATPPRLGAGGELPRYHGRLPGGSRSAWCRPPSPRPSPRASRLHGPPASGRCCGPCARAEGPSSR